ncbi:hypothetical protein ACJMK2_025810 [Sinanodonta woodiana]|uniref:Protein zer-1 homolog-like C-terminal domain-containing protein n=1 Tax=Sinanodonta woodiana TaxID=1069815 RepID=A0ABD3XHP0_SINWO
MHEKADDFSTQLKCCKNLAELSAEDSIEVIMTQHKAIGCLIDAIHRFVDKPALLDDACAALLKLARRSESSCGSVCEHDGVTVLFEVLKHYPERLELQRTILDIFGYISSLESLQKNIIQTGRQGDFLIIMSRLIDDVTIVKKCCIILGNIASVEVETSRSLMYIGAVHCIISMMNRCKDNADVLQNGCRSLGLFASHDETCVDVASANAPQAVLTAMTSFPEERNVQESGCWALACLTRKGETLADLNSEDVTKVLYKAIDTFPNDVSIQEYGAWVLCNLSVLECRLNKDDERKAVSILVSNILKIQDNIELQEEITNALAYLVTDNNTVQEELVKIGGLEALLSTMRRLEDNVNIQTNGCRAIGNMAVNKELRTSLVIAGAPDVVVLAMLNLDRTLIIQEYGCVALTNVSADDVGNKIRVLKCGTVPTVLNAMKLFNNEENLQLCALRTLKNLIELDNACWSLVDEEGVTVVKTVISSFPSSMDIQYFGCQLLAHFPRKGVPNGVLEDIEKTLLHRKDMCGTDAGIACSLCSFYQNLLISGCSTAKTFTQDAFSTVINIMDKFSEDNEIQICGCKIVALLIAGSETWQHFMNRRVLQVVLKAMTSLVSDLDLQIVACGTLAYLSDDESKLSLLTDLGMLHTILKAVEYHKKEYQLNVLALIVVENLCKLGLDNVNDIGKITATVSGVMNTFPTEEDIQLSGCHILTSVGKQKKRGKKYSSASDECVPLLQRILRRGSADQELLEAASLALKEIMKVSSADEEITDDQTDTSFLETELFIP